MIYSTEDLELSKSNVCKSKNYPETLHSFSEFTICQQYKCLNQPQALSPTLMPYKEEWKELGGNLFQNKFEDEFVTELNNELHLSPYQHSSAQLSSPSQNSNFYQLSLLKRKQSDSPKHPSRKTYAGYEESIFSQNIKQHRRGKLFHESCQRGAPKDIEAMQKQLQDYPKKYLRSAKDPEHLINKKFNGQTPLYVASKNGNLAVVKFLLQNEAQISIPAVISTGKKVLNETPLEVAVRWDYKNLIEEFLKKGVSHDMIKKGIKCAQSQEMKEFLSKQLNK